MDEPTRLYTVTDVAAELNVRRYRVDYAIRSRKIEPQYVLGGVRAYDATGLERIRAAVAETFLELRKREIIRSWMGPGEELELDDPNTSKARVAELVHLANQRARIEYAERRKQGLTDDQLREQAKQKWRAFAEAEATEMARLCASRSNRGAD